VDLAQFPDRVRVAEAQHQSDLSAVRVAESEIRQRDAALGLARKHRLGCPTAYRELPGREARPRTCSAIGMPSTATCSYGG
jgi:hypothetical protein